MQRSFLDSVIFRSGFFEIFSEPYAIHGDLYGYFGDEVTLERCVDTSRMLSHACLFRRIQWRLENNDAPEFPRIQAKLNGLERWRHFNVSLKSSRVLRQPIFEIEGSKAVRVTYHGWFILFEVGEKLWQGALESFDIGFDAILSKSDMRLSNMCNLLEFYNLLWLLLACECLSWFKVRIEIYGFMCFASFARDSRITGSISLTFLLIALQTEMCFNCWDFCSHHRNLFTF